MSSTTAPSKPALKRLGFVWDAAAYAYGTAVSADTVYQKAKSIVVPKPLLSPLTSVERTLSSSLTPVLTKAQDLSTKVLNIADDKVDYVVTTADNTYKSGRKSVTDGISSVVQIHEKNMKTFSDTTAAYTAKVQKAADWATENLNPVKGGKAALATVSAAVQKAKEATDPDVAAKLASDAWTSFSSVPIVAKTLTTAEPVTKPAINTFYKLHDTIVSLTVYKKLVDTSSSTLVWASSTTPYKLGAQYVYPLVQPVADPALDKLSSSKVVADAISYWKPTAAAA